MSGGVNPRRRGEPRLYKMHAARQAFCISFLLSAFNFLLSFPCGEPRRCKMRASRPDSLSSAPVQPECAAHDSLRPEAIGIRAARRAGKSPPTRPMAAANWTARQSKGGVTSNANVTWLKVCQLMVEALNPSKSR